MNKMSEHVPNLGKKVKDIMQRNIISVNHATPVVELTKIMKEKKISGLIVVDAIGEVLGVISALDVFKILKGDTSNPLTAEDIMTPFTIEVSPESSIVDAALAMLENDVHRLVVTASPSKRKPVGIITSTDIINGLF